MIKLNVYAVIAILVVLIVACFLAFMLIKNKKKLKIVALCALIIYLAILGIGVFSNVVIVEKNLVVDFTPKGEWFTAHSFIYYNFSKVNVCVNLFMFIPLGMTFYVLFDKHKLIKTILLSLLFSLLIEFGQFALPVARTVELTDLLYNTISGIIGFLLIYLLDLIKKKIYKKHQN